MVTVKNNCFNSIDLIYTSLVVGFSFRFTSSIFISIGLTGIYNTIATVFTAFVGSMLLYSTRKFLLGKTVTMKENITVGVATAFLVSLLKLLTFCVSITVSGMDIAYILAGVLAALGVEYCFIYDYSIRDASISYKKKKWPL